MGQSLLLYLIPAPEVNGSMGVLIDGGLKLQREGGLRLNVPPRLCFRLSLIRLPLKYLSLATAQSITGEELVLTVTCAFGQLPSQFLQVAQ